ncbi:DUF4175 family protein [Gimesia algae]|uniref:Uncharacterized protein n=1 Tax=Gimesia algae TaxID=2527971 RepID=A0A517V8V3_9PLAN|nr:DUF4175 family protein [Gimesia algae]QDT89430.1 hypothetical protein Pan161_10590 [Gimesia algae]
MGLSDLIKQLNQIIIRYQTSVKLRRLTVLWLAACSLTLLSLLFLNPVDSRQAQLLLLAGILGLPVLMAVGILAYRPGNRFSPAERHAIATMIERTYPELDTSLLATLELEKTTQETLPTFLQDRLIQQVLTHGRQHDWRQTISNRRLILQSTTHLLCFGAWFFSCLSCWSFLKAAPTKANLPSTAAIAGDTYDVEIKPGSTEVEMQHPLLVTARFKGKSPDNAELFIKYTSGETKQIPLVKHLDDPVFAARLPAVTEALSYQVQTADWKSETFRVKVYILPELVQLNSNITAPDYTGQPDQNVEDSLTISAIIGSKVELEAHFNKPISTAVLEANGQTPLEMIVASDGLTARLTLTAESDQTWNLKLIDSDQRENRTPPFIDLAVIPNLPPEIKITFPGRDTRVSPLEESLVQGTVVDDYGLQQVGFVYSIPGQTAHTVKLKNSEQNDLEFAAEHLLSLEQLQVQPDTLISYYLFAEDFAADGSPRRVSSDMFFMEVRHFEEIFRQGKSAGGAKGGKSGGNAQQAEKLAEQQKQIINATWKVIRREIKATVSAEFKEDVSTLKQAQQALVTATLELAAKVKVQKSKAIIKSITTKMQETVALLDSSLEAGEIAPLTNALSTEQTSYQLLLKLRAREHRVSQNKNGGGSKGGGSNRSQNQLQQLELTNQQQRYETENQATAPQAAQPDRETLQILNRLRELAQRQKDLNEQLKALADKQRFAKTDQEREEIERQLKRLREKQRELLRKADEVAQRMDQSKQPSSTKSRRELEQTRNHLQQSSESLKEGQVSRALNSGTRAQQQLDQLKNDFRKKTANQFADTMRGLKQQAEQLDEKQKQIHDQLDKQQQQASSQERRSLRRNQGQQELANQLQDQENRLKSLMDQMKQVVQESEKSEPLLSKHLYDAIRKTRPYRPEDALKNAAELLKKGDNRRAQEAEQRAAAGIDTMKQGIQMAAESVLGNDLDALKKARQELKSLTSELKQETSLAANTNQADPGKSSKRAASTPAEISRKQGIQQPSGQQSGGKPSARKNPPGQKSSGPSPLSDSKSNQPGKPGSPDSSPGSSPGQGKGQKSSPVQLASAQSGSGSGQTGQAKNAKPSPQSMAPKSLKGSRSSGNSNSAGGQGGPGSPASGPLTGNQFREWSDRMRDVEEMVGDAELRSKVAQIRERAQSMRADFKRHSKAPQGDLVNAQILEPLVELQNILSNEISKRGEETSLAPIDRDPVPEKYSDLVRLYYEELGNGK